MIIRQRIVRLLIVGDRPQSYWVGSSTLYIQEQLPAAIANLEPQWETVVYVPHRKRDIVRFLLGPVSTATADAQIRLIGGIIPILFHLIVSRYDVVHFIVIRNFMIWLMLAATSVRKTTVVTFHDTLFLQHRKLSLTNAIKRIMLAISDFVLSPGEHDRKRLNQYAAEDRIRRIRNGISPVIPEIVVNHSRTIVFGGGIGNDHSGLQYLRDSISITSVPVDLEIYGTASHAGADAFYKGMVERRIFHDAIRRSRMTIVPSRYESFSMTALESLSLGIPVIISDQCGIVNYLKDETDCLIVRYGDTAGLREKIERLMTDDQLWSRLSRNGITTARNFLWTNVAPEYSALYSELAGYRK